MTSRQRNKPARSVILTRNQIEDILVCEMAWEREDADIFWRLARREARCPGFLAGRRHRRMTWLAAIMRKGGAA